jgi:hypothetical protein
MRRIRQIKAKEKGFALCATALGCGIQSIGLISRTEKPTVGAGWGGPGATVIRQIRYIMLCFSEKDIGDTPL